MTNPQPVITLTTDFGTRDPYVASIKGVITSLCPQARLLDLSHEIAAHDIVEAAVFIATAARCYPAGTIHLVVVDPGVGTKRNPIVVKTNGQYFVGPDNGVFALVLRETPLEEACIIAPEAGRTISRTFHGRDLFAPAACRLAMGARLASLGSPLAAVTESGLFHFDLETSGSSIRGAIVHIDRFGNCITNIDGKLLTNGVKDIIAGRRSVGPLRAAYGDVEHGEPVALIGSTGYLEVAMNQGHAARQLALQRGDRVEVRS